MKLSYQNDGSAPTPVVHPHITDAVKAPSLVRLSESIVLARFENLKLYAALGAVRSLLANGTIDPGYTLVDSSSGNYALALAIACHRYGLGCHIVVSTTVDTTLRAQLEILGATVDQVPPSENLQVSQQQRVARIQELLKRNPNMHWMRQYHDPIHHLGYAEVAQGISDALPGAKLSVVASVGTGSSSAGIVQPLRQHDPTVHLVGVQPFGSMTFGAERFSDPEVLIAGIGSGIHVGNVRHDLYDAVHWVSFRYSMAGSIALLHDHAVFAGLSTGAAYLATMWEAAREPERTHLVIGGDTGHRYVEKVFAQHHEAPDAAALTPIEIESLADLTPPWSVMPWQRRPYQTAELAREPESHQGAGEHPTP